MRARQARARPGDGGRATLLKFGCEVVSIKIAGINISRGEKRLALSSQENDAAAPVLSFLCQLDAP